MVEYSLVIVIVVAVRMLNLWLFLDIFMWTGLCCGKRCIILLQEIVLDFLAEKYGLA